jgi:hypothetical protein
VVAGSINEMIIFAYDFESLSSKLALDGCERHFVPVFWFATRSPINDDQPAGPPKRLKDMSEHQFRIAEFVVSVADQYRVHGADRQARIVFFSDDGMKIVLTPQECPAPQEKQ